MKKKLLAFVLVMVMILSLTACGSKGNDSADTGNAAVEESAGGADESAATEEPEVEEEAAVEEEAPVEEEAGMTLADWMDSSEAEQAESITNAQLIASGITVDLKADGDVFVYEYTMPDEYSELSEDEMAAAMEPTVESYAEGIEDVFNTFESEYGIKMAGVRFTFILSDGTELYSVEIAND